MDVSEDLNEVLGRYAFAVSVKPSHLFAMTTGRFEAKIGNSPMACMIDTGSELNIVSAAAFDAMKLPLDIDGARWSLRGISGEPVTLQGCARDVPVEIGGHRFDHHFFVAQSGGGIGKQDVILGQPWLQWYAATIKYACSGPVSITLSPEGDELGGPSISLRLIGQNDSRNVDRLVHTDSGAARQGF